MNAIGWLNVSLVICTVPQDITIFMNEKTKLRTLRPLKP